MAVDYNENSIPRLKHLASLATRVKAEIDTLDGKTFSSVDVSGGKINFYATTDHSGTALESIDLPEEIFLDQAQTTFIQSFAWSNVAYPGSTNPNLEGKPVLVLAVKGDKTSNATQTYSFINLERLVDTYTAADNAIGISGYSIGLNLAADATNILSIEDDGLLAELKISGASQYNIATFDANGYIVDGGLSTGDIDARNKVDKVTSAVTGNIATFGTSGAIADSGYTTAGDSDISAMLTTVFSTISGGVVAKPEPTLTLDVANSTVSNGMRYVPYEYDGDGKVFVHVETVATTTTAEYRVDRNNKKICFKASPPYLGTLYATEGKNYAAAEASFAYIQFQ